MKHYERAPALRDEFERERQVFPPPPPPFYPRSGAALQELADRMDQRRRERERPRPVADLMDEPIPKDVKDRLLKP